MGRHVQINIHCSGLITAHQGPLSPQDNLTDFLKREGMGMKLIEESQKYFAHSHSKSSFSDVFMTEWSSRNYVHYFLLSVQLTRLKIKIGKFTPGFPGPFRCGLQDASSRRRDFFEGSWEKNIHSMMGGVYILDGIGSSLLSKEAS